jgi:hypothetical protein
MYIRNKIPLIFYNKVNYFIFTLVNNAYDDFGNRIRMSNICIYISCNFFYQ